MSLSVIEKRIRKLLIHVAKGTTVTERVGRISYKEVWEYIHPDMKWGQSNTKKVVDWITRISAFELKNGRPPLNELVTPKNKLIPQQPWGNAKEGIKAYLKGLAGTTVAYGSHEDAQQACWEYWAKNSDSGRMQNDAPLSELEVEEGYREDRQATFFKRNKQIIAKAKQRDKFKCQACGFFIKIDGKPLIDCHHIIPLRYSPQGRVTRVGDLICLCPTCHRIAHTRSYPLSIEEIRRCRDRKNAE
jgi:hypothetical protein